MTVPGQPDQDTLLPAKFGRFENRFVDRAIERQFRDSVRDVRRRFLFRYILFGSLIWSLVSLSEWMLYGPGDLFWTLFVIRQGTAGFALVCACILRLSNQDRILDLSVAFAMAAIGIAAALMPMLRVDDVAVHEVICIGLVLAYYSLTPLPLRHLLIVNVTITITLAVVMLYGLNEPNGKILGIMLPMLGVHFVGAWTRQRYARLLRLNFAQTLRLQTQSRQITSAHNDVYQAHRVLDDAFHYMAEGVVLYDSDGKMVSCNDAFREMYGYKKGDIYPGMHWSDLAALDRKNNVFADDTDQSPLIFSRFDSGQLGRGVSTVKLSNGRWLQIRDRITPSGDTISLQADITDRKSAEEQIRYFADHDSLTGLTSLRAGLERLNTDIEKAEENNSGLAVMFLDLDGFKKINDVYGHDAGDFVLKTSATRMIDAMRDQDMVARIGGDEFLLVMPDVTAPDVAQNQAGVLLSQLTGPIGWKNQTLHISASIGIAMTSTEALNADNLVKRADKAMYAAKHAGKNRAAVYTGQEL